MENICHALTLTKDLKEVIIDWHRYKDGQQLPEGFTGRARTKINMLPQSIEAGLRNLITKLEDFIVERESALWIELGIVSAQVYSIQIVGRFGKADLSTELLDLHFGIAFQYYRLDSKKKVLPSWWDGNLLFDKRYGSWEVYINGKSREVHSTEDFVRRLAALVSEGLMLGNSIANELEGQ